MLCGANVVQLSTSHSKQLIQLDARALLQAGKNVGVDIQSQAYGRMPESLLHNLRMNSLPKHQAGGCMSEIVKANVWESGLPQQRFEVFQDIAGV